MADDTDEPVLGRIKALADEEHALYERGDLHEADLARLQKINLLLDQAWDLLRQRRALREFGRNPDDATVRPASVVDRFEG